jgi:hypothetical protein
MRVLSSGSLLWSADVAVRGIVFPFFEDVVAHSFSSLLSSRYVLVNFSSFLGNMVDAHCRSPFGFALTVFGGENVTILPDTHERVRTGPVFGDSDVKVTLGGVKARSWTFDNGGVLIVEVNCLLSRL